MFSQALFWPLPPMDARRDCVCHLLARTWVCATSGGLCLSPKDWAAANGGVTNGGLRGVWPPFLEIGRNRPFSPFFCLFRPFPEGAKGTWKIQKTEEKGLFPQISSDLLKPPSLKPPFVALQKEARTLSVTEPGRRGASASFLPSA